MNFRQMADIYQLTGGPGTSPITPQMLYEAAPLQGKSKTNQEIAKNQQAQQQQAQQAQQVQQTVLQSQLEYNKAASVEKLSGAKERFTRSVANMGLEDERASKAIENRASAALERSRAMAELAQMGDERLLKYLSIIRLMEETNRVKEEEVKEDDVEISAQGEASVQPVQPMAGGVPVVEEQSTMEVTDGL